MSDTATREGVRRVTRVRMLGDAVPVFRGLKDSADEKVVPKSSDEMRADREERRDAAPMSTSCGVDGCSWPGFTGTAGECRAAAAAHRASTHPELAGRKTHRKGGVKFKRPGEEVDSAVIEESRRIRREREDKQRLDTINRGRAARGEDLLLEEVAADRLGPDGATSSSSPNATERSTVTTICKIDGCDEDASDAPKAGPTSRLCATHRAARSAEMSAARTGRPRGARGVKTVIGVPPEVLAQKVDPPEIAQPPALRDPIRTADIPYDADLLESEAAFLRDRAGALEQIAGGIRRLSAINAERAA